MRKFNMWIIKLAFAALFFTLIVEIISLEASPRAKTGEILAAESAVASTTEPKKSIYPYTLTIPAINISAGVVGMGLTSDGKMAVPNNYTEVGWYGLGAQPGEKGSVVLGAHVDNGGSVAGVFKRLKDLSIGDEISLVAQNGLVYRYRIVEKKIYDYKTKVTDDVFLRNDKERLNLITCHGKWLPQENTYDSRLIIFAERSS